MERGYYWAKRHAGWFLAQVTNKGVFALTLTPFRIPAEGLTFSERLKNPEEFTERRQHHRQVLRDRAGCDPSHDLLDYIQAVERGEA